MTEHFEIQASSSSYIRKCNNILKIESYFDRTFIRCFPDPVEKPPQGGHPTNI